MPVVPTGALPVSKLFLSCDLTGSTAFKQLPRRELDAPWQKVFLQFYREFPQQLFVQQKASVREDLNFELWKAIGDELIFTCDVESEVDIFDAIHIWVATLRGYKSDNLEGHPELGVKGGAFIGTFPGPDHESTIPRNPGTEVSDRDVVLLNQEALRGRRAASKYLFDYFGPSIDTGFRVVGKSSDRYMTLSLEVAYALSVLHCTPKSNAKYQLDSLVLLDQIQLKGVWDGRDYPLFAIDLRSDDCVNRALRSFNSEKYDVPNILRLCQACYSSPNWVFRIFLPKAESDHFSEVPHDPLAAYLTTAATEYSGMESEADDEAHPVDLNEEAPTD